MRARRAADKGMVSEAEGVGKPGGGAMVLWTVGYGAWPAARRAEGLLATLVDRGVRQVVDVRLNPCASDPVEGGHYGSKPWTLQAGGLGIVPLLATAGIAYEWVAELGNPQRRDRAMTVLRAHLDDPEGGWPVHRGLDRLADRVITEPEGVALLCACEDAAACHRTLIALALSQRRFGGRLDVRECRRRPALGQSRRP